MALYETLSKIRIDKHHIMSHELDPFPVHLSVFRGLEPQLQSTRWPLLRPYGHGHQHDRLNLIRIVQAILKRDASSQGETNQH
jgi:hypothetical protein